MFGCFNIVNNDVVVMLILLAIKDDLLLGLVTHLQRAFEDSPLLQDLATATSQ